MLEENKSHVCLQHDLTSGSSREMQVSSYESCLKKGTISIKH